MEYDKDIHGNSLEIEWVGAMQEREEQKESLAHSEMDRQEEIRTINRNNRKKLIERLKKENTQPF